MTASAQSDQPWLDNLRSHVISYLRLDNGHSIAPSEEEIGMMLLLPLARSTSDLEISSFFFCLSILHCTGIL